MGPCTGETRKVDAAIGKTLLELVQQCRLGEHGDDHVRVTADFRIVAACDGHGRVEAGAVLHVELDIKPAPKADAKPEAAAEAPAADAKK